MAINYGAHAVWGSDWTNAQRAGNTALMQKYQSIMDAEPQAAQQIGMIGAKTADMGRGTDTAGGIQANGLEYNTVGQSRTPGIGATNSLTGGGSYTTNPGAWTGTAVGTAMDPTPTMTQAQYGAGQTDKYSTNATWGADYRNALASGNTTLAQKYRTIMDQGAPDFSTHTLNAQGQSPWNPANTTTPAKGGNPGTQTKSAADTGSTTPGGSVPGLPVTQPIATGGTGGVPVNGAPPVVPPPLIDPGTTITDPGTGMINVTPGQATQTNWNVTPDQTVRSQLAKAYDPNDPLQVKAKTEALQNMNDRGLLNSSLAETAGQQAMLGVALPIAQADATTYGSAAQTNATQANQISQSNAQLRSQAAITNATLGNARWTAQLDATTKEKLANIEATYKKQMQMSSSASSLWTSTLQHMTSIMESTLDNVTPLKDANGNVIKDSNGNPMTAKQSALNQLVASLATGLQVMGRLNDLNVDDLLNFG